MKTIFLAILLFCFVQVKSSCGLENCKCNITTRDDADTGKNSFSFDLGTRYTNFSFEKDDGYYTELFFHFSFVHKKDWMINFKLPFTSLHFDDKETSGLSNPVLNAEKWFRKDSFVIILGLQIEIPIGEEDKGIAPDHWELLPYAGFSFQAESYFLRTVAGYRFAVEDEKHSASPTNNEKKYHAGHDNDIAEADSFTLAQLGANVVNFHAKEELQLFVSGGKFFFNKKFILGLQGTFRQTIGEKDNLLLMYGGPSITYITKLLRLQSHFSAPFSSDKKMNWSAGINLIYEF